VRQNHGILPEFAVKIQRSTSSTILPQRLSSESCCSLSTDSAWYGRALFCAPSWEGLHATWVVNSVSHIGGARRFQTRDSSTNNWWVALLSFGDGWHNNHHAHRVSARHGLKWYEIVSTDTPFGSSSSSDVPLSSIEPNCPPVSALANLSPSSSDRRISAKNVVFSLPGKRFNSRWTERWQQGA
jgi:hypothetical protein